MDVRSGTMRTLFAVFMAAAWVQPGKSAPCSAQEAGLNGCSSGLMQIRALDKKTRVSTRMSKLGEDIKKMIDRKEIVEDSTLQELRQLTETWSKEIEQEVADVKKKTQEYAADVAKNLSEAHSLYAKNAIDKDARDDAEKLAKSMASKEFRFNRLVLVDKYRKHGYTDTQLKQYFSQSEVEDSVGYHKDEAAHRRQDVVYGTLVERMKNFKNLCFRFVINKYHCDRYADIYSTTQRIFDEQMGLFEKTISEANEEDGNRKKVSCYIDTMEKNPTKTVDACDTANFIGEYTFTKSAMPGKEECDGTGLDQVANDYGAGYAPKNFTIDSGDYSGKTVELKHKPFATALGNTFFTREKNCERVEILYSAPDGEKGQCDSHSTQMLQTSVKKNELESCKLACNFDETCLGFQTVELTGDYAQCTWFRASTQDGGIHCKSMGETVTPAENTKCYRKIYNDKFENPCPAAEPASPDGDLPWPPPF